MEQADRRLPFSGHSGNTALNRWFVRRVQGGGDGEDK